MKREILGAICCIVVGMTIAIHGCAPQMQQTVPSASFPLAGGKIWPDTTVRKNIDGLGTFLVSIKNGQINVTPPQGLNVLKWSITSIKKTGEKEGAAPKMLSAAPQKEGDRDGDGVPDCEDWCVEVPGPPENNGCPEGMDGIPPIRWAELMKLEDNTDKLVIEFGIEGCPEQ